MHTSTRLLLVLLLVLVSACNAFQEYLLSGEATLTGALTLLSNGRGFDSASLSVEKGGDFRNHGQATLRQLQGCTVDLFWDIDANGQTSVKEGSTVWCEGVVTALSGTIDVRDYAVDDYSETESAGDTGAKVTLGVDGVRDPAGGAVLSGSTTLAFGSLATGAGGGGGGGGGAGGCDLSFEGQRVTSTWARCPRAEFMGGVPQALNSYPDDLSWEITFATYNGQRMVSFQAPGGNGIALDAFTSTGITVSGETFTVSVMLKNSQTGAARGTLTGTCTCNDY